MDDDSPYVIEDLEGNSGSTAPPPPPPPAPVSPRRKQLLAGALLAVIALGVIVGVAIFAGHPKQSPASSSTVTINTQSLGASTLQKVTASDGATTQHLNIAPDSTFQQNLTVDGAVSIAKGLQIGANLVVGGNLTVSGLLSASSLNVNSLNLSSLHLTGDATFSGHLVPNGSVPRIQPDNAAAGGTTSIDGNDTAGTLTIVTGPDPSRQLAGELAIITFHSHFTTNARVELTPVNGPAASLQYYVTQSPTYFSVETGSTPTAGQRYIFNYFVSQ